MVRRKSSARKRSIRISEPREETSARSNKTQNDSSKPSTSHHKSKNKSTRWAGPSTKALMEIRKYQKGTNLLIPRLPFHRLVKQIVQEFYTTDHYSVFRMGKYALEALQESAEAYMVQFMEDAFLCTLHSKRVTLQQRDLQLVRRIRGHSDVINR
uniref:Core Histone H2A/H2B/H3 domain-containing protein n=1 Tax=Timema cristinae TaxID=61476 RepID=A0A7R9CW51_TIMCR|nr:unnamed protein product [Timema cristinae]